MTIKLLNFHHFEHVSVASWNRARKYSRAAAYSSRTPAPDTRLIPHLRAPLECRWQIEPITGALLARWVDPRAGRGAGTSAEEVIDDLRCRRQPLRVAGGSVAARAAA
jgi:hypothetical protein